MKQEVEHTCSPNCIYFPQQVDEKNIIEETRRYGILFRKVKRYCRYDGHLIESWTTECPKNKKQVKNS